FVLPALAFGSVTVAALAGGPRPAGHDPAAPRVTAAADGVTVKDLTEKEAAVRKSLEGTREMQKQEIDDKHEEFQLEVHRHTFAERTVRIEYKTKDGRITHDEEVNFTVNPTTTLPEITLYSKNFLVMGVYELNGDTLKIAHHGISELERPRGFAVKDKRI